MNLIDKFDQNVKILFNDNFLVASFVTIFENILQISTNFIRKIYTLNILYFSFAASSGGKREWVYTNIRVKPNAQNAFNKAIEGTDWMSNDNKNGTRPDAPMDTTPSSPDAPVPPPIPSMLPAIPPITIHGATGNPQVNTNLSANNGQQTGSTPSNFIKQPQQQQQQQSQQNGNAGETAFEQLKV